MEEQRAATAGGTSQETATCIWPLAVLILALTLLAGYVLRAKAHGLTPLSRSGKANSSNDLPARVYRP